MEQESTLPLLELKGLTPDELEEAGVSMGLEPYRGRQIAAWIYGKGKTDFEEMTTLSKEVRRRLKARFTILDLHAVTEVRTEGDDAVKYLFELPDGNRVESVLMWEGKRRTLCLSSQVGCPLDCRFCATGRMGLLRNLTAGEILDQLIAVRRILTAADEDLTNVVMMGMGEPLLNYEPVVRAIRLMNLDYGPAVGIRRITLSTVGHVPGILRLAKERLKIGLAVSLNATTDAQRSEIMSINRKWQIRVLLDAVRAYQQQVGRRVTFEYVLLHTFNDTDQDAERLVDLVRSIPCKINLIPWNPIQNSPFCRPPQPAIEQFVEALANARITATVRYSKGADIAAGCGQLYQDLSSPQPAEADT